MSTKHTLQTGDPETLRPAVPKDLGMYFYHHLGVPEVRTEITRREPSQSSSFPLALHFRSLYHLGAGLGPMAWRLMHASGRNHLLQCLNEVVPVDPSLEPFCPNMADAYCYHVALKRDVAASALHSMALADGYSGDYKSPMKTVFEQLRIKLGRKISAFEDSSLEAYLLSPLMGPKPQLVRRPRPRAESDGLSARKSVCPAVTAIERIGSVMRVPPVELAPAGETVPAEELAPAAAVLCAAAASDDSAIAVPHVAVAEIAGFQVGDLVKVKGVSAPGNRGYRCIGMPSAHVVEVMGGGIYLVSQAGTTPELPFGSRRRVHAYQLSRLDEMKTVGDAVNERSGNKSVSRVCHKRMLVEAQEATRVAEKKAARAERKTEKAELELRRESKRRRSAEDIAEVKSLEVAAMTSGGTPDSPRYSRHGRDTIKAMYSATDQGRLARQLMSAKKDLVTSAKKSAQLRNSLEKKLARETHLKDLANRRALEANKGRKRVSKDLSAQQKMDSTLAKAKHSRLPLEVQARIDASAADTIAAELHAEELEIQLKDLDEKHVELMRQKWGSAEESVDQKPKLLWKFLGERCTEYAQDVVEMGLTLMANRLSAKQAVGAMRAFLRFECPDKKEGVDYRMPSEARFQEWRRMLEPICHYLSVSVITLADRIHIMHDATTKNHIHIIQSVYRCEITNEDGSKTVVDVPMRFDVCPSGKAVDEAP